MDDFDLPPMIRLDDRPAAVPCAVVQTRMAAAVIGEIGAASFDAGVLAAVNLAVPAVEWSAYVVRRGERPTLQAAACHGRDEVLQDVWARYSASLHYQDAVFSRVWAAGGQAASWALHGRASELSQRHREELYDPQGLASRLSWVQRRGDALWTLNLYRHHSQADFAEADVAWLHAFSDILLACIAKHLQWRPTGDPWSLLCPSMTVRERQVCNRLLKGWTHDGIAADLQVTPRTVKTYRDRAFARLGIHHRFQLFERVDRRDDASLPSPQR